MKSAKYLKLERPVGVYEGDGTLSVHPCRALFVAENSESRGPYSRQSGSYHFVCGFSGSLNAAVTAGIRARGQSCLPTGPMDVPSSSRLARVLTCAHTHEHRPNHNKAHNNPSATWIERLARRRMRRNIRRPFICQSGCRGGFATWLFRKQAQWHAARHASNRYHQRRVHRIQSNHCDRFG